jgi:uncharacterized protein YkwD
MSLHRNPPRMAKLAVLFVGLALVLTACMSEDQQTARNRMNADRVHNSRSALAANDMLSAKAQKWADLLARNNSLSHSKLTDGISGCWRSIGENVGFGGSIAQVETAYMNSAGHRANILNASYDAVGTGVTWRGSRVFTVQVFMDRC